MRRAAVFIRHLEEDEIGELLQVIAVAHAVVTQRCAETPDFGNDGISAHENVEPQMTQRAQRGEGLN
jgi:hypothetical protein